MENIARIMVNVQVAQMNNEYVCMTKFVQITSNPVKFNAIARTVATGWDIIYIIRRHLVVFVIWMAITGSRSSKRHHSLCDSHNVMMVVASWSEYLSPCQLACSSNHCCESGCDDENALFVYVCVPNATTVCIVSHNVLLVIAWNLFVEAHKSLFAWFISDEHNNNSVENFVHHFSSLNVKYKFCRNCAVDALLLENIKWDLCTNPESYSKKLCRISAWIKLNIPLCLVATRDLNNRFINRVSSVKLRS